MYGQLKHIRNFKALRILRTLMFARQFVFKFSLDKLKISQDFIKKQKSYTNILFSTFFKENLKFLNIF